LSLNGLEDLLREISPDAPSGENLEYDPDFMRLERDLEGTPAVEVDNKVVQESKEPDWQQIRELALQLLNRSHDLRPAVALTRALLHTRGFMGLGDALSLIHQLVEGYWDTVHPQLDPEDNDPTERVNVLETLADWHMFIAPLMKLNLCSSRAVGNVNFRQCRIVLGKTADLTVTEEEVKSVPTQAAIDGAFAECAIEELEAKLQSLGTSLDALRGVRSTFEEKVGGGSSPDLSKFEQVLAEIHFFLKEQLSRRGYMEDSGPAPVEEAARETPEAAQPAAPTAGRRTGVVENRGDVLRVLGQVCTYYEQNEPASPVPLLLRRAMRLVEKNFLEILEDLAPDSLGQVRLLSGVEKTD